MDDLSERTAESKAILAAAGLVYVSDASPGIRRVRQGDKFVYMLGEPCDPARGRGRLDLPQVERAPAGDRTRRPRPQAVSLPSYRAAVP